MNSQVQSPQQLFTSAQTAHQAGHFDVAESAYRALLQQLPNDADTLHFLGLLRFQRGEQQEGVDWLRKSLAAAPNNPHAWNNLGNMLVAQDQSQEAAAAYERATELAPDLVQAWYNLGICYRRSKRIDDSVSAFCKAVALQPSDTMVYERFGMLLYGLGRFKDAADIYRKWLQLEPANATARHMLAAMTGEAVPERADDEFLKRLFDGFASNFDEQLAALGYRAPELLVSALGDHVRSDGQLVVLDAGCGTGLCGVLLRSMTRHLVGVDLSAGMVAKAQERKLYDELEVAELCEFMRSRPAAFDVVISADTLVYFGALAEAFTAARGCLRPGGTLAFTLERLNNPPDSKVGFAIQPHGRYAHTEEYLRSNLQAAGFNSVNCRDVVLRKERGQDVAGYLVVAS